jgi:hypothetical protein
LRIKSKNRKVTFMYVHLCRGVLKE